MDELAATENRLSVERMRYNERVQATTLHAAVPVERHRRDLRVQGASAVQRAACAERVPRVNFGKPS